MAVYQAARVQGVPLGARGLPRARPQAAERERAASPARTRVRPASVLVAVILGAAMLGFAYLTQTLVSAATGVEIHELRTQAAELQRRIKSQEALLMSEASPGNVRDRAISLGLTQLKIVTLQAP